MELTEVKIRPILFSTTMVQAILEGRKTQTRRIIKHPGRESIPDHLGYMYTSDGTALLNGPDYPDGDDDEILCPYGKPGDILWVRETWALPVDSHGNDPGYQYKADFSDGSETWNWRPSIFMPKDACRLFLEITDVKVQRLKSISRDEAISEGISQKNGMYLDYRINPKKHKNPFTLPYPGTSFMTLWESINGSDAWYVNPWVWVISFKRISKIEFLNLNNNQ